MSGSRRGLTAMARLSASRPIKIAVEHQIVTKEKSFFDFGCGRGADVDWLKSQGWNARGWDPEHRPKTRKTKSEIVAITYVINVIEVPAERDKVLREAWGLTRGVLIVSARLEDERDEAHIKPRADGWMTSRGTFQKFYGHLEIGDLIRESLGVDPIPAAPGVWYVFRRLAEREKFLSMRYMIRLPAPHFRKSDESFVAHRELLQELIEFFARHGRLPVMDEISTGAQVAEVFGTIGRAFRVVEVVTDRDEWLHLTERRRIDLLVYLATKFLDGEYKMKDLSPTTQRDVRAHYQSFVRAAETSLKLLFAVGNLDAISMACRSSNVGKLTPSALYVHVDAYEYLPSLLKVYEACARRMVGDVAGANIIKLHRDSKKISYLHYPDFDVDPHPSLVRADVFDLIAQSLSTRHYSRQRNVPILHRKEEFIHKGDRRWEEFQKLTREEEAIGLYEDPSRIGYRDQWNQLLQKKGLK